MTGPLTRSESFDSLMTNPRNPSRMTRYLPSEQAEYLERCRRRLREELGVNPGAVEVILHLRRQILDLQSRLQALEAELETRNAGRSLRIAEYQQWYYEAAWVQEEEDDDRGAREE